MRMKMIGTGVVAAVLAAGVSVAAGQDAKSADVLAKTRAALGKAEKVKTLSVEASMQRNMGAAQLSSEVELLVEMPDKYVKREESRGMMNMSMANGFNGDRAIRPGGATMSAGGAMFFRMGPGGPVQEGAKPTPEQLEQINEATLRSARAEASRFMLGWLGMAHPAMKAEYRYLGEAESPDGRAHVIEVKDPDGFESRLFIDQNNHLPLMVTYQARAPRIMTSGPMRITQGRPSSADAQGAKPETPASEEERKKMAQDLEERVRKEAADQPLVEFSLFFDDWREVDGLMFPHLMRRGSGGETTEEWTVNKVKVNGKLDAKKFAVETK